MLHVVHVEDIKIKMGPTFRYMYCINTLMMQLQFTCILLCSYSVSTHYSHTCVHVPHVMYETCLVHHIPVYPGYPHTVPPVHVHM
jgi:hypothetical protein